MHPLTSRRTSVLDIPFPTPRLALIALRSLRVDKELSSLVARSFELVVDEGNGASSTEAAIVNDGSGESREADGAEEAGRGTILRAHYRASTNRMLRVAVRSYLDSVALVLDVMASLDSDIVAARAAAGEHVPAEWKWR